MTKISFILGCEERYEYEIVLVKPFWK